MDHEDEVVISDPVCEIFCGSLSEEKTSKETLAG